MSNMTQTPTPEPETVPGQYVQRAATLAAYDALSPAMYARDSGSVVTCPRAEFWAGHLLRDVILAGKASVWALPKGGIDAHPDDKAKAISDLRTLRSTALQLMKALEE